MSDKQRSDTDVGYQHEIGEEFSLALGCKPFTEKEASKVISIIKLYNPVSMDCWDMGKNIHRIVSFFPGFVLEVYCGMEGSSVDIILNEYGNSISYGSMDVFLAQLLEVQRRRQALISNGFRERGTNDFKNDSLRSMYDNGMIICSYTKPIGYKNVAMIMEQIQLILQNFCYSKK